MNVSYVKDNISISKDSLYDVLLKFSNSRFDIFKVYPYWFDKNEKRDIPLNPGIDSETLKKDFGKFYTKDTVIIDHMLNSVNILSGKILEPSCGTGDFCVRIISKMIEELKNKGFSSEQILLYIADNFYANDIDANAVLITEINVIYLLMPLLADAYHHNPEFIMPKLHMTTIDFIQKDAFNESFSVIIGNPPFITMYGKHSRHMTEEKRSYFNTFDFVRNKSGNNKFNVSMFFIENGLKSLAANGQLSFILDVSFLETAYKDLRKYLLENYFIQSLTIGLNHFQNVASGQIILTVKKVREYNPKVLIIDNRKDFVSYIHQENWIDERNDYRFSFPLNDIESSINDKVNSFQSLDTLFPNKSLRTCCALTGKTDEFKIKENDSFDGLVLPYLEGSKGIPGKFCKPIPSFFIKMDYELQLKLSDDFKKELSVLGVKNKKRVTLGDVEIYQYPKLFIRQSAKEIIATYSDCPLAANNSIYILSAKRNDSESLSLLKYVCGILNSNLITFYCRMNKIIRAENGQIPQIKISDLKKVKICVDKNYVSMMMDMVDVLLNHPENKKMLLDLNDLVYKIYGISDTERVYIESYLST